MKSGKLHGLHTLLDGLKDLRSVVYRAERSTVLISTPHTRLPLPYCPRFLMVNGCTLPTPKALRVSVFIDSLYRNLPPWQNVPHLCSIGTGMEIFPFLGALTDGTGHRRHILRSFVVQPFTRAGNFILTMMFGLLNGSETCTVSVVYGKRKVFLRSLHLNCVSTLHTENLPSEWDGMRRLAESLRSINWNGQGGSLLIRAIDSFKPCPELNWKKSLPLKPMVCTRQHIRRRSELRLVKISDNGL